MPGDPPVLLEYEKARDIGGFADSAHRDRRGDLSTCPTSAAAGASVRTAPGSTLSTVIAREASSRASTRTSCSDAALPAA